MINNEYLLDYNVEDLKLLIHFNLRRKKSSILQVIIMLIYYLELKTHQINYLEMVVL